MDFEEHLVELLKSDKEYVKEVSVDRYENGAICAIYVTDMNDYIWEIESH